jgi:hypothetical protein
MDNNVNQDEFEQFLQDEVKQHRMYPSDHIWKNIRTEIHGYKAWPALTFISLFIITALTISTLLNNHPDKHLLNTISFTAGRESAIPVKENRSLIAATISTAGTRNYFQQMAPSQITAETFAEDKELIAAIEMPERNTSIDVAAVPVKTFIVNKDRLQNSLRAGKRTLQISDESSLAATIENTVVPVSNTEESETEATNTTLANSVESVEMPVTDLNSTTDVFLKDFNYVTNSPIRRNSKFGFQFYITPSNSYRRLSDEKVKEIIQPAVQQAVSAAQNVPLNPNLTADVNNVVRHKPAVGLELGFAVLYNMTGRLKFKTGLQLNIRQYYIETFQSTNDLASLSLINNRGIETISFYSPFNNNTGYKKAQLDNKVYQLSVPIGLQWDIINGKRFGINTEASVQPTFTINNNTYLLSTDYKHYTTGNEFVRKWNINTSVGLNLTYQSGATSFQLGPQIRYQHLPTFSNLYPIKEYLIDYGIRFGITRQIK